MILAIAKGIVVGALDQAKYKGAEHPWPHGWKELTDQGITFDQVDIDLPAEGMIPEMERAYRPGHWRLNPMKQAVRDLLDFFTPDGAEFTEDGFYECLERGAIEYDWQKSVLRKLQALAEATGEEQAVLSVIEKAGDSANTIVEHRLVRSADANDALLDACSRYVSNWDEHTDEDKEAISDNGYYETGTKMICVVHLDLDGEYRPES